MAILVINGSFDYSSRFLFNVNAIDFTAAANATFSGTQFYGNQLSDHLAVDGSFGVNTITVNSGIRGFSAAGWSFTNWDNADRLVVNGSQWNETLVGSVRNDVIRGNDGNDTISAGAGNDIVEGGAGRDVLDGGIGIDALSYAQSAKAVSVNLATNVVSGGDATNDSIAGFEIAIGGFGNDRLTGSAVSNILTGGYGADLLEGGGGADRFNYNAVSDSLPSGLADLITDFSQAQHDRIQLSNIDAVAGGANDAFRFVGSGPFEYAGDLRYTRGASYTLIEADIDGDGRADLAIRLAGSHELTGGDFIL